MDILKVHFQPAGEPIACGIGWTADFLHDPDPHITTCLRCAATKGWRVAMHMPPAATGWHATALALNGPTLQLRFFPHRDRTDRSGWWQLWSGRRLMHRYPGFSDAPSSALIIGERWARLHGFNRAEFDDRRGVQE